MIRIATWNIEHFNNYFNADNTLKTSADAIEKFKNISDILNTHVKPDLLAVVEAPNTTISTGNQSAVIKLENFASDYNLSITKCMQGFVSSGTQELAIMCDPNKMSIKHKAEGSNSPTKAPKFDAEFHFDADDDDDKIKEMYKHYRPPLETKITLTDGTELWMMLVHAKSKGIFDSVEQVHLERISRRNRL